MIYDCFTFFNELDLLEIRLNTLRGVVDKFVIAEATRTHTGKTKELVFQKNRERFSEFDDKIIYVVVEDLLPEEEVAKDLYNQPWVNENRQRNALVRGLVNLESDDVFMLSDCDEIPRPELIRDAVSLACKGKVVRFELENFVGYLNLKDYRTPRWQLGTIALTWGTAFESNLLDVFKYDRYTVASECQGRVMQKVRFLKPTLTLKNAGWHMTYMGGAAAICRKIKAFSHQEAAVAISHVEERLAKGVNILNGRKDLFAVPLDDRFPAFLMENKDRYAEFIFKTTCDYIRRTKMGRIMASLRGAFYRLVVACIPRCLERPLIALRRRIYFR